MFQSPNAFRRFSIAAQRLAIVALAFLVCLAGVSPAQAQDQSSDAAPQQAAKEQRPSVRLFEINAAAKSDGKVLSIAQVSKKVINIKPEAIDFRRISRFEIPLPSGEVFTAEQRESEGFVRHNAETFSWNGKIHGENDFVGDVMLSVSKNVITGLIYTPLGVYSIIPQANGTHYLVEIDQNRFPDNENDYRVSAAPENGGAITLGGEKSTKGHSEQTTASVGAEASPQADAATQFDVMIVYTDDVRAALGSVAAAEAFAASAISSANTAYQNSGITTRMRLVRALEVNYAETADADADLDFVSSDATVAAARNASKADVVAFFTNTTSSGLCGLARLMRTGQNNVATWESQAFSVSVRSCAVDNLTFAHEVGHNQGANHHPAAGLPANQAVFPYAFGHFNTTANFRTVVAAVSSCPSCPRIPYFSNPNVNFNGAPTGIADQRDNVRTINGTADTMANLRQADAPPASTVVTNTNDSGAGSLRQVVTDAAPGSTITFANNVTGAINLSSGEILIDKNLTIQGPGARTLSVQRAAGIGTNFRIFRAAVNTVVTISGLRIANGNGDVGGGIYKQYGGSITLNAVTVANNTSGLGGGIYVEGSTGATTATITNSTFTGNTSSFNGGGIQFDDDSLVTGTVANTTVSGNTASGSGGGIRARGQITLNNVTIVNNTGSSNGGVSRGGTNAALNIRNTIVANNTGGGAPDVSGTVASRGNNLIGNTAGSSGFSAASGDVLNQPAQLGALANNGGQTDTHLPAATSPAISAGNNCVTNSSCASNNPPVNLTVDQRGVSRPQGATVDIGSVEVVLQADLSITKTASPNPVIPGSNITYTITVANNGPGTATSVAASDPLPPQVSFNSFVSNTFDSCEVDLNAVPTPRLTCSKASLANGATASVTFNVQVNQGTPNGTVITNTATVSSGVTDPNTGNNSSSVQTSVSLLTTADLVTTMTVSPDSVAPGGTLTYQITVANNGNTTAQGVQFSQNDFVQQTGRSATMTVQSISAPAGWFCSATPGGPRGTTASGDVSCRGANLAPGASAQLTITKQVPSSTAVGTILLHRATATTTSFEENTGNNVSSDSTTVTAGGAFRPEQP